MGPCFCGCGSSCKATLTVTLTNCAGVVSGAAITIKQGTSTLFTGTTDVSGEVVWSYGSTTGVVTVSWSKSGLSGSQNHTLPNNCTNDNFSITYANQQAVQVTGCNGGISGATVQIGTQTATTDASGNATIVFTSNPPISFNIQVTLPTGPTQTVSTGPSCSVKSVSFVDTLQVTVTGCNGLPLPGASVSWTGYGSGTTDSSGNVVLTPTSYIATSSSANLTVSATGFTTYSQDTVLACSTSVALTETWAYGCCGGTPYAIPQCWSITDAMGTRNVPAFQIQPVCENHSISGVLANTSTCATGPGTTSIRYQITCSLVGGVVMLNLGIWFPASYCCPGSGGAAGKYPFAATCGSTYPSDVANYLYTISVPFNPAAPSISGTIPATVSCTPAVGCSSCDVHLPNPGSITATPTGTHC